MKHESSKKAARFKVENRGFGELAKAFPHSPEDFTASIADYIEDMHSQGWDFIQSINDGNGYRYFFKAV